MKILLLEDEIMLNSAICEYLENIGHMVKSATNGEEVLEMYDENIDLLILDINTPKLNGFEVLSALNEQNVHTPTIFISALNEMEDISKAYDLGAKEYIKKPFHLGELGIKINLILKQSQGDTNHVRFSKNYSYSKSKKTLYFKNEPQRLTKKQQEIIHILALNINIIVNFEQFRLNVWEGEYIDNPTIRAEISRLKKSLHEDFIKNIRGLGYKIDRYYSK